MLENRDYMREEETPPMQMTITLKLIIVLVVAFALQCICDVYVRSFPVDDWLALTPQLFKGWLWQLVTFQFLHADLLHLTFNMIGLWYLGRFCEPVLGTTRFLVAFFGTGIMGGLLQGVLMVAFPLHFPLPVVGASAGVCGLMAIFALLQRNSTVRFNFILPMPAIVLLYIMGGISLFFTLVPTPRERLAHAAHLGGILAGMLWVKLRWHEDYIRLPWERLVDAWRERRSRRPVRLPRPSPAMASAVSKSVAARKETARPAPATSSTAGPTEFISKEVDPILDKIAAHGIHSLTAEEKKVLENARSRIEKR